MGSDATDKDQLIRKLVSALWTARRGCFNDATDEDRNKGITEADDALREMNKPLLPKRQRPFAL